LTSFEIFICERENFVFDSLIHLEPVKRIKNSSNVMKCRSFGDSTSSRVKDKLKTKYSCFENSYFESCFESSYFKNCFDSFFHNSCSDNCFESCYERCYDRSFKSCFEYSCYEKCFKGCLESCLEGIVAFRIAFRVLSAGVVALIVVALPFAEDVTFLIQYHSSVYQLSVYIIIVQRTDSVIGIVELDQVNPTTSHSFEVWE